MKLYEIDAQIESLIDEETGEILDIEAFQALQMEREKKIENIALWIKNLQAEADAIQKERKVMEERERVTRNKIKALKERLNYILNGEKFKTPKVAISYRTSKSVEVDDGFVEWAQVHADECLKYKAPEVDKSAVKRLLLDGKEMPARIVERKNIQIK